MIPQSERRAPPSSRLNRTWAGGDRAACVALGVKMPAKDMENEHIGKRVWFKVDDTDLWALCTGASQRFALVIVRPG